MEDAGDVDFVTLRNALPGELGQNAVIDWHNEDLERTYQSALRSEWANMDNQATGHQTESTLAGLLILGTVLVTAVLSVWTILLIIGTLIQPPTNPIFGLPAYAALGGIGTLGIAGGIWVLLSARAARIQRFPALALAGSCVISSFLPPVLVATLHTICPWAIMLVILAAWNLIRKP